MKNVLISALVSALVSAGMFFGLTLLGSTGGGRSALVDVPNLTGLTAEQARQLLEPLGLLLDLTNQVEDSRYGPGQICDQAPLGGSRMPRGQSVRAKLVRAGERVKVPALTGRPEAEARAMLEAVHLKVGGRSERIDEKAAAGSVLGSAPADGAEVAAGAAVDLVIAAAPLEEVPRVTGRSLASAKQALGKAGFAVGDVKYGRNEDVDDGVVLRQTPAATSKAPVGSKVDLVVNSAD